MHGSPGDDDIFKGTSKNAESFALQELFKQSALEGLNIDAHVKDGDSTSSEACLDPHGNVYICGGHFNRAFGKCLEGIQKSKKFTKDRNERFSETI